MASRNQGDLGLVWSGFRGLMSPNSQVKIGAHGFEVLGCISLWHSRVLYPNYKEDGWMPSLVLPWLTEGRKSDCLDSTQGNGSIILGPLALKPVSKAEFMGRKNRTGQQRRPDTHPVG